MPHSCAQNAFDIFHHLNNNIMNKTELIKAVAAKANLTQAQAKVAVEATFNEVAESLKKKEAVMLLGFGNFTLKDKPAGTARNPQTGATIKVPAKTVIKFKPATAVADAVK